MSKILFLDENPNIHNQNLPTQEKYVSIRLVVKGTEEEVLAALSSHQLPSPVSLDSLELNINTNIRLNTNELLLTIPYSSHNLYLTQTWFLETHSAPYPPGTLLLYSAVEKTVEKTTEENQTVDYLREIIR